jgi:hypothetical protein
MLSVRRTCSCCEEDAESAEVGEILRCALGLWWGRDAMVLGSWAAEMRGKDAGEAVAALHTQNGCCVCSGVLCKTSLARHGCHRLGTSLK